MALEIGTATDHADLYAKLRAFVVAGENASQTLTLSANAGNTETVTIDSKVYTFQTSLTNVDGNVLIGATALDSLNNLRQAINLEPAGSGISYAAATVVHPSARAVNGAGNTLVARAKAPGTGGNSMATTETLANGSWGDTTMNGGGVNAWTELSYNGTNSAIYNAPGLSGAEEIGIGLGFEASVGTDSYALTGWMFRSYNAALSHTGQPGYSGLGYHAVWNQPTPYWFIGNGQRVIVVTKISTVYTASYIGKFLMYGAPGEYPQPYVRLMTGASNVRWSSTSPSFRCFFDPGNHAGTHMLNPNGNWYAVINFTDSGGNESAIDGQNYIWPYNAPMLVTANSAFSRYRELRDNVDDVSYTLWPLIVCGENPSSDIYGELDGAFACPGFDTATEDEIYQGGEFHLLVQNCFRTQRYHYGAIQLK
jgi:hypothetical protein